MTKVLIVDDREENQLLLREQLDGLAAEIVGSSSGVRALRELRATSFDLVVTDLLMPEMDGYQLCHLLKTDPALQKIPVVIYTANYATKQDEEQAMSLGADDFITRPIDKAVLLERLRRVLGRAAAGQVSESRAKPTEGFSREYSSLLIEKLEDQLIAAEEHAGLREKNAELQRELASRNAALERANADLRRANEDLQSFSYSVSHDLRAPVRAIEGMLSLLVDEVQGALTPEAEQCVRRIEFNTQRMNALITGVLDFSRIGNVASATRVVDIGELVAAAVAGHHVAIRDAKAQVNIETPMPRVMAHEQALTQIVTHLVDNAVKFVAPGTLPVVTIRAAQEGGRVRLNVCDNGIGVRRESQSRLFQIFERLAPDAGYAGTGIGLAIVRRGVERMGGTVGVESTLGRGSSFWVELNAGP